VYGMLRRLASDDRGQDLIEYALLVSFIGLAVVGTFGTIINAISAAYGIFNSANNALWESPNP
jgi:Flp pilus assembly pilin Flp